MLRTILYIMVTQMFTFLCVISTKSGNWCFLWDVVLMELFTHKAAFSFQRIERK